MSGITFKEIEAGLIDLLLKYDPVAGTQLGLRGEHDGWLPPSDAAQRQDLLTGLREIVDKTAHAPSTWDSADLIDCELALAGMKSLELMDGVLRPCERNPDWYLDSALTGIYAVLMRLDTSVAEKVEFLRCRLRRIPEHLRNGIRQIKAPPQVLLETARANVDGAIDFLRNSLGAFIASLDGDVTRQTLTEARDQCLIAVEEFTARLELLSAESTGDFALGKSAFNCLLKETHRIRYDSDQLLDLGHQVAANIEREMESLSLQIAGHRQWWVTLEPLAANHPSRDDLLDEYRRTLKEAMDFVSREHLVDLSGAMSLEVAPTPAFARANLPFAAYVPVPPFAASGRAEFWVTPIAEDLPSGRVEQALRQHHAGRILVAGVHEAYPGHHVQFSHAFRVRRPLRHIFSSTVFVEGWAFYCEELMRSAGFRKDHPQHGLLELSQLRDQLWRALRIVLDVGLHCNNMSQSEATALLTEKHVLDSDSAAAEVMYYCSAPTQPMSYMVGRLLIEDLIAKCRAQQGGRFTDLYSIHNELLAHGALPFSLMERAIGLN